MRDITQDLIKKILNPPKDEEVRKDPKMTKVLCGFEECIFCEDYDSDEEIGICSKEEICLDEAVEDVIIGCPDAEFDIEKEIEDEN